MSRLIVTALVAALGLTASAERGYAQEAPPQQPAAPPRLRPLFGGTDLHPDAARASSVTFTFYGGQDNNSLPGDDPQSDPRLDGVSRHAGFQTEADYFRNATRSRITLSGTAGFRYYENGDWGNSTFEGTAIYSYDITTRTTFRFSETASYEPYFLQTVLPGGTGVGELGAPARPTRLVPPGTTFGTTDRQVFLSTSGVSLEREMGPRTTLGASYGLTYSHLEGEESDLSAHSGTALFRHRMTTNLAARVNYRYHYARFPTTGSSDPTVFHDIDAGVDYTRRVTVTPNSILTFESGSTLFGQDGSTHFRVRGAARLTHYIGRIWIVTAAYDRGLQFVALLDQPAFGDTVFAGLDGQLSRKFDAQVAAAYSTAPLGFTNSVDRYKMRSVTARARYAFSRHTALYGQYLYYFHEMGRSAVLPADIPPQATTHGLRIGFSIWLPMSR